MNVSSVGVSGFVNDRKSDVDFIRVLNQQSTAISGRQVDGRKRKIDKLRYRTKSFQSYKIRKPNSSAKGRPVVPCRRQRRRKALPNASLPFRSHVWSVKRMFMRRDLGVVAPATNKKIGAKAVERFAFSRCVMQDLTYLRCVLLSGSHLLESLSQFIDPHCPLLAEFGCKNYQRHVGEVELVFHRRAKFPSECIGAVLASHCENSDGKSYISLWMHPAIYEDVLEELSACDEPAVDVSPVQHLSRVSLRGPKTAKSLLALLDTHLVNCGVPPSSSAGSAAADSQFLRSLLQYKHLTRVWRPNQVLSVALSHSSSGIGNSDGTERLKWPKQSNRSGLWGESMEPLTTTQPKRTTTSRLLAKLDMTPGPASASVHRSMPMVLIRKSHRVVDQRNRRSELEGWDLVFPRQLLGRVWQGLLFTGAIAIGSDEATQLRRAVGALSFPRDFLDTAAGRRYWDERSRTARVRSLLRPPRNRPREAGVDLQSQLGVLAGVSQEATDFPPRLAIVRGSHYSADFAAPPFDWDGYREGSLPEVAELPPLPGFMLLNVTLTIAGRGLPRELAQILRPLESDIDSWLQGCERRRARRASGAKVKEPSLWRGVKLGAMPTSAVTSLEGRKVIGVVTSGHPPHTNSSTVAVGACQANHLNRLFKASYGKYPHPQAHSLVLQVHKCFQFSIPFLYTLSPMTALHLQILFCGVFCSVCWAQLKLFRHIHHRLGNGILGHISQRSSPTRVLATTPMYYVSTSSGSILHQDDMQAGDPSQKIVTHFMSSDDAARYLELMSQAGYGNDCRIRTISLEKSMQQIQSRKQSRKIGRHKMDYIIRIQPSTRQVDNARRINRKAVKPGSIPMFTAEGLAVKRASGEIVAPFYFSLEDMKEDWNRLEASGMKSRRLKVSVRDLSEVLCLVKGVDAERVEELASPGKPTATGGAGKVMPGVVPPRREIGWLRAQYARWGARGGGMNGRFSKARDIRVD